MTNQKVAKRIFPILCCAFLSLHAVSATAQMNYNNSWLPPFYWADYDPLYRLTHRVRAQADLIRAQGNAAVDFAQADAIHAEANKLNAEARQLNAEAFDKELDNWMKKIRTRWNTQIMARQKSVELNHANQIRKMTYLNDRKWNNHRKWETLKGHPELTDRSVRHGQSLNFLLNRLSSANALPYKYDASLSRFSSAALADLKIEPEWLPYIVLKQQRVQFTAADFGKPSGKLSYWPFYLQWEQFDEAREKYEAARARAMEESTEGNKKVSLETIRDIRKALNELTVQFEGSKELHEWAIKHKKLTQRTNTRRFLLADLDNEVDRLEETRNLRPSQGRIGWTPEDGNDHIVSLLSFMNRNGIQFAPAKPGQEDIYHKMFDMMRSLYLTVADADESIQPEDLRERMGEKL